MKDTVTVPALNANDVEAVVIRWMVTPWQRVEAGEPLCDLETTKVTEELLVPSAGYVVPAVEIGAVVKVGEPLAFIFERDDPAQLDALRQDRDDARLVSNRARDLLTRHGLSVQDVPGEDPVDGERVERLIAARAAADPGHADALAIGPGAVLIYGTGSHALVAHDALLRDGRRAPVAFIDYAPREASLAGLPVLHEGLLPRLRERGVEGLYVCLPTPAMERAAIARAGELGFELVSVVDPAASVAGSAVLAPNVFVGAQCVIGPEARLASRCRILNAASVAHHCDLAQGVHVSDGARLAGNVTVGEDSLIGLGVTVNKQLTLGSEVTVVSGVSVYADVPAGAVVRAGGEVHLRGR